MTLKRGFDVLVGALMLAVSSPLWAIAAVLVKLSSPGPSLHRSVRTGKDGVPFTLLKFRTMRIARPEDGEGPGITSANDPRITPVGRALRRLKIDELPQLLNVLAGDMSLVGPRPEDPRYTARYTSEQRRVLSVRPGITGPASIAYRDEERLIELRGADIETRYATEILPAKLQLDLAYVDGRSFWSDILTLLRTGALLLLPPRRRSKGP